MHIRNWRKYQHYKKRNPPWIKIYKSLLDDRDWHALSGDASKMLANCLLLASENNGALPSVSNIAWRLRLSENYVARQISQLVQWVTFDASTMLASRKHGATPETETETEIINNKRVKIEDWKPNEKHIAKALKKGIDLGELEEAFRDYVAEHPKRYSSLDRGFNTFLRNAPKFNGATPRGKAGKRLSEVGYEIAREMERRSAETCGPAPDDGGGNDHGVPPD